MIAVFQVSVAYFKSGRASGRRLLPVLGVVLLAGVGSLTAATVTLTWDPLKNGTGSDAGGTAYTWDTTTADFASSTGGDTTYSSTGTTLVTFGNGGTVATAPVVTLTGSNKTSPILTAGTLSFGTVSGPVANGYVSGYTFNTSATTPTILNPTTLKLNTAPTSGANPVQTLTTINAPLTVNTIIFAQPSVLSLGSGSTQLGLDSSKSLSPNITANSVGFAAASTLSLNAVAASTETYVIGTSIGIGTTGTITGATATAASAGVQVNSGATLEPAVVVGTTAPLTDLGVGGYAAVNANGNANGSGLLTINAGGIATTINPANTSSTLSNVYINNNTSSAAAALSGRLIVNGATAAGTGGVLIAGNQVYLGNSLSPGTGVAQSAELDVNAGTNGGSGGVVYLSNANNGSGSIFLNYQSPTAAGTVTALLNISGGVTTLGTMGGISFNHNSDQGTSILQVSGGSLYVGANGLASSAANTSTPAQTVITFSGGTIGAVNTWGTSLPITLSGGTTTFQTSNVGASTSATTFYTAGGGTAYPITLSGALTGSGGLTVNGGGVSGGSLTLSAANTYTGTTTVGSGSTLLVNGSLGSAATANGAVTVNNGGTLQLNGSIGTTPTPGGAVTVNSGGTLLVNSTGSVNSTTLTVNSGGLLGGTGLLNVTSATVAGTVAPGASSGATSGTLTLNTTGGGGLPLSGTLLIGVAPTGNGITAGSSFLTTSGTLTLSGAVLMVSGSLDGASSYEVASYGAGTTVTGTFASSNVPSNYYINYAGTNFGGSDIELDVSPIPEPGTLAWTGAALAGLGLLHRRRRLAGR